MAGKEGKWWRKESREVGREGKEGRKNGTRANKGIFELKISNFRYHRNCFRDFLNKLHIDIAKSTYYQTISDKATFNYILNNILNEESKIWNKNELLNARRNKGGTKSNNIRLVNWIQQHLKDETYCFKAPEVATVIIHKKKASKLLNLVSIQHEDESLETEKLAMQIKSKKKNVSGVKKTLTWIRWKIVDRNNFAYLKWYTGHDFSQIQRQSQVCCFD